MTANEASDICHLLARLTDAVELLARDAGADAELGRLQNIRHDTLMLMGRIRKREGAPPTGQKPRSWFWRSHSDDAEFTAASLTHIDDLRLPGRA